MYMPHELMALIRRAGFVDVRLFGGVDGAAFERTSPRCVISARKPE
jgi:hypothetical protein